jgi:flagellar biosynthetic protein FliR
MLFATGLQIAFPVIGAMMLANLALGMLTRTAPQLNLFAVGFPAALLAGIVLLAIAAPVIGDGVTGVINLGLEQSRRIATGN